MGVRGALIFAVLLSCVPAVFTTCFVSEVLGVTACTGQSRVDRGSRGGEELVVLLDPPGRDGASSSGHQSFHPPSNLAAAPCKCTAEHNPVCLRSTGERVGRNPSCAICDGHPAEDLITCSGLDRQPSTQRVDPPCGCSPTDQPICDRNTGRVVALNACLARCNGLDASRWTPCASRVDTPNQIATQPDESRPQLQQNGAPLCRCPKNRDPVCDRDTRDTLASNECMARCAGATPSQFIRCRELPPLATTPSPPSPPRRPIATPPVPSNSCRCPKILRPVCDRTSHERLADNECLAICAGLGSTRLMLCSEVPLESLALEEQPNAGAPSSPGLGADGRSPPVCSCPKNIAPVCDPLTGERLALNPCLAQCDGVPVDAVVFCDDLEKKLEMDGTQRDASELPLRPGARPAGDGEPCSEDGVSVGEVAGFAACTRLLSRCSGAVAVTGQDGLQVLPLCSTDAKPACLDTAMEFATRSHDCLDFLTGSSSQLCDGPDARRLFRETVEGICRPN